jgi:hypothetical protein
MSVLGSSFPSVRRCTSRAAGRSSRESCDSRRVCYARWAFRSLGPIRSWHRLPSESW